MTNANINLQLCNLQNLRGAFDTTLGSSGKKKKNRERRVGYVYASTKSTKARLF